MEGKNKILLHGCCGPCITSPLQRLREEFEVIVYFYNPNIYPEEEYYRRLESARKLSSMWDFELLEGEYHPEIWENAVRGLESEPEGGARCLQCFRMRLKEVCRKAVSLNVMQWTTTLTVSPRKNSRDLFRVGREVTESGGTLFLPIDFKKKNGFLQSVALSREADLYRQNYCGCRFSVR